MTDPWNHNPLCIAETYGGWEADAAWGAAWVSAGAAVSAGGLIGLEALGVTSIGSTPLWGGGTTAASISGGTAVSDGFSAGEFANLMNGMSELTAANEASAVSSAAFSQSATAYCDYIWTTLMNSAEQAGLEMFGNATLKLDLLKIAMAATTAAFGPGW